MEDDNWAITVLSPEHFTPYALPRMVTLHPVSDPSQIERALRPWQHQLSTLALPTVSSDENTGLLESAFPRICEVGHMQRPPFPRRHDGKPMLGSVLTGTT